MGRKLLWSLGSRLGFFRRGWTEACLKLDGTTPVFKQLFITARVRGQMVSKTSLKRREGMMSEGLKVDFRLETTSDR